MQLEHTDFAQIRIAVEAKCVLREAKIPVDDVRLLGDVADAKYPAAKLGAFRRARRLAVIESQKVLGLDGTAERRPLRGRRLPCEDSDLAPAGP
jgi:hypothetical protein